VLNSAWVAGEEPGAWDMGWRSESR